MKMTHKDQFKVGDEVLTNISSYKGRITGIVVEPARSHYGSYDYSERPVSTYRVSLPFQISGSPEFRNYTIELNESNLRRP